MRLRWGFCRGCGLGFRIFAGDVRLRLGFLQGMCASGLDFCRGCALAAGIFAGDVRLRLGFCSGFARGAGGMRDLRLGFCGLRLDGGKPLRSRWETTAQQVETHRVIAVAHGLLLASWHHPGPSCARMTPSCARMTPSWQYIGD